MIMSERSEEHVQNCDVPQDLLGPNLEEDYTATLIGSIFRKHSIEFHIYADDTEAYVPFEPADEDVCLWNLDRCIHEIKHWMATNWLKLNDSRTEFIIF